MVETYKVVVWDVVEGVVVVETLAIGEIGSASIFWRNIKLVRLQEVIY